MAKSDSALWVVSSVSIRSRVAVHDVLPDLFPGFGESAPLDLPPLSKRTEQEVCDLLQAWLGHASIATTNIYLHHLGSSADRAGLARLNALGARGVRERAGARNDNDRGRRHRGRVSAGGKWFGVGAACRNRTDDLLITSETLYRLS